MPILRVSDGMAVEFAGQREAGMGVQVGLRREHGDYVLIVDTVVAVIFDSQVTEQARTLLRRPWMDSGQSQEAQEKDFRSWLASLDLIGDVRLVEPGMGRAILGFIFHGPSSPLGPPPQPPAQIFGHLPFEASSGAEDVYYRYEPFPISRRIDQAKGTVTPGTYAAPASELPFMPTGLAAVARCALPSLFPARWRWELQPEAGTTILCGASVPLYGQSGGGVEVMFRGGATNRGPVANPVVLPIL